MEKVEIEVKREDTCDGQDIHQLIEEGQVEAPKQRVALGKIFYKFFDFLKTIALIVILAFLIRLFLIQPFIVEGQSMEKSFSDRDYLITEKITYDVRDPQRGEIIIFHPPDNMNIDYIKRVIALPGDRVSVSKGSVFVNGVKLSEPYLSPGEITVTSNGADLNLLIKNGEFFVLGDNRNHSRDSREIGPIPKKNIVSRVWFRLYPFDSIRAFAAVNYSNSR